MECWYCHWGWPKPIMDIYDKALAALRDLPDIGDGEIALLYGPAHIVWEDENFQSAQWCLDNFDEYRGNHSDAAMAIVRTSLKELLLVDKEFKSEPDAYFDASADDSEADPHDYPPPSHWIMMK